MYKDKGEEFKIKQGRKLKSGKSTTFVGTEQVEMLEMERTSNIEHSTSNIEWGIVEQASRLVY